MNVRTKSLRQKTDEKALKKYLGENFLIWADKYYLKFAPLNISVHDMYHCYLTEFPSENYMSLINFRRKVDLYNQWKKGGAA